MPKAALTVQVTDLRKLIAACEANDDVYRNCFPSCSSSKEKSTKSSLAIAVSHGSDDSQHSFYSLFVHSFRNPVPHFRNDDGSRAYRWLCTCRQDVGSEMAAG